MLYAEIHFYYTLPILAFLVLLFRPALSMDPHRTLYPLLILSTIVLIYTTPWDNYLVKNGGWSYPPGSVIGVIGYVPLEEYSFFLIQTWTTGLLWIGVRWARMNVPLAYLKPNRLQAYALSSCLVAIAAVGWSVAVPHTSTFYIGTILFWCCPVLAFQVWLAWEYILATGWDLWVILSLSTCYYWYVDTVAIGAGSWTISEDSITGIMLNKSLPMEEAVFFLVTNMMILFGLAGMERTHSILTLDSTYVKKKWTVYNYFHSTIGSEFDAEKESIEDLEECRKITIRASSSFYLATLLMPVNLRYKFWKVYAFARATDDMIDEPKTQKQKLANLETIRKFLENFGSECVSHPAFRAIRSLDLPQKPLLQLLKGYQMDVDGIKVTSDAMLEVYCECVASSIGSLSLALMASESLSKPAEMFGLGLQLVNIARDVAEDWRVNKRIYLPNISEKQLENWVAGENNEVLVSIKLLLQKFDKIIDEHKVLDAIEKLPAEGRRAVLAANVVYSSLAHKIMETIESNPAALRKRISTPKWRKAMYVLGIWISPELWLAYQRYERKTIYLKI